MCIKQSEGGVADEKFTENLFKKLFEWEYALSKSPASYAIKNTLSTSKLFKKLFQFLFLFISKFAFWLYPVWNTIRVYVYCVGKYAYSFKKIFCKLESFPSILSVFLSDLNGNISCIPKKKNRTVLNRFILDVYPILDCFFFTVTTQSNTFLWYLKVVHTFVSYFCINFMPTTRKSNSGSNYF